MARQGFHKGQTVYTRNYANSYRKGIVANPDVIRKAFAMGNGRNVHYVSVAYVDQDGKVDMARTYHVLNNRRQIIDESAYREIARAKSVNELRRDIVAYTQFEEDFIHYFDQAAIICRAVLDGRNADPSEVNELAHYLRGTFAFAGRYARLDREGVRVMRREKRATAASARVALVELGEEAPELVKEAGA